MYTQLLLVYVDKNEIISQKISENSQKQKIQIILAIPNKQQQIYWLNYWHILDK